MGAWGTAAWDNDGAADWFGDMFDATGLAKHVEKTLQQEADDFHEEIRAAAYLLIALGRVYVWPIDDLDNHLALAISKLEEIKVIYEDSADFVKAIEDEIGVLRSRLKKQDE
jgi:hypothetical protein